MCDYTTSLHFIKLTLSYKATYNKHIWPRKVPAQKTTQVKYNFLKKAKLLSEVSKAVTI